MEIKIKGTTNKRADVVSWQYSGTFMNIPILTVKVTSPTKINFEVGDYIVWSYDNCKYVLRDLPSAAKQATSGSYGEAFIYEGMAFVSELAEMKNASFLDVVLSGSGLHFTGLPSFSFYGSVYDLVDRINANLVRLYADWEVVIDSSVPSIVTKMQEVKLVEASNVTCWEALNLTYSLWKVGFVYSYNTITSKHIVTIAGTLGDTGDFEYGQGKGLYLVKKTATSQDSIVTRLRAYGSDKNLPTRYYNNKVIGGTPLIGELQYVPNLLIPYDKWGTTGGVPDVMKSYIDSNNPDVDASDTAMATYGIREKTVYFDGSDLPEIKPTIEGITAGELRAAIASYSGAETYYAPSITYGDSERMDTIKVGDDITDSGFQITARTAYQETDSVLAQRGDVVMTTKVFSYTSNEIYFATLNEEGIYDVSFTEQYLTATCLDAQVSFGTLQMWLLKNGTRTELVKTLALILRGDTLSFQLEDFKLNAQEGGDIWSIQLVLDITLSDLDYGQVANLSWALDAGTVTYRYEKSIPHDIFTITLKQIGFNIAGFAAGSGQNPIISMKTGSCAGREFTIQRVVPVPDGWQLTCKRQSDQTLDQWFPNNTFKILAGDYFVLLSLAMPEILVEIGEDRLYVAACDYLRENKKTKYIYEPKVDEVYMAINPEVIKEGMTMPITDTDLGIAESIIINSVSISQGEEGVPTYDVVLREDTDKDLLSLIAEQGRSSRNETVKVIVNSATTKTQSVTEVFAQGAAFGDYDDSALWEAVMAKEPLLPPTPSAPTMKYLNGNRLWSEIVVGSGGYAANVYLAFADSDISGYKTLSYTPEETTNYCSQNLANTGSSGVLCATFLYPDGVGVDYLDAGSWNFHFFAKVDSVAGEVSIRTVLFSRDEDGVETEYFDTATSTIINTSYEYVHKQYITGSYPIAPTDRVGIRVYGVNTKVPTVNLSFAVGDGNASYFNTPLATRHKQLRGLNEDDNYQHITKTLSTYLNSLHVSPLKGFAGFVGVGYATAPLEGLIFGVNGNSYLNGLVKMTENDNLRLRIPKTVPENMTEGEWYLYISDSGFTGEVPSGGGVTSLWELTELAKTGTEANKQLLTYNSTLGKWTNTTIDTSFIDGFSLHTHTVSQITDLNLSNYALASQLNASALTSGYLPRWDGSKLVDSVVNESGTMLRLGNLDAISRYSWGGANTNVWIGGATNNVVTGVAGHEGNYLIAIGLSALLYNTTGYFNNAIGVNALRSNTTGYYNNAIGVSALSSNTTGYFNNAIGVDALFSNTTGTHNNAIGASALSSNTTGTYNNAIGVSALSSNTTGYYNNAIGVSALSSNTTGTQNNAIGVDACRYISDGSRLTVINQGVFIGSETRALADNSLNEVVIGHNAIGHGNNTVTLGNSNVVRTILRGDTLIGYTTNPSDYKFAVNGSGYFNGALTVNGRLKSNTLLIPTTTPDLLTGEWGLYISDSGFTGEVPSGGGVVLFSELSDVSLSGSPTAGQVPMWTNISGDILLRNTTLSTSDIDGLSTALSGKEPTITAGTSAHYYRGDKTWQSLATAVLALPLTSYSVGSNAALTDTDTILQAFGKVQGQINAKAAINGSVTENFNALTLTANGNIALTNTTYASQLGVINKGSKRFLHDFTYGFNGSVTPIGRNIYLGEEAGNFTMGSGASTTAQNSYNNGIGYRVFYNATHAFNNNIFGSTAALDLTSGFGNTIMGHNTGRGIQGGYYNTILGAGVTSLDANLAYNIILATGDGTIRARFDGTNWALSGGLTIGGYTAYHSNNLSAAVFALTLPTVTPENAAIATGNTLSVAFNRAQGQIAARALLAGSSSQNFSAAVLTAATSLVLNGYTLTIE